MMSARIVAENLRWGIFQYEAVTLVQDGIVHRHRIVRRELPFSEETLLTEFEAESTENITRIRFSYPIVLRDGGEVILYPPDQLSFHVPNTKCTIFHDAK